MLVKYSINIEISEILIQRNRWAFLSLSPELSHDDCGFNFKATISYEFLITALVEFSRKMIENSKWKITLIALKAQTLPG